MQSLLYLRPIFLVRPAHHDLECIVLKRPLQGIRVVQGARIQTSGFSSVVRITGIAFCRQDSSSGS